MGRAILIEVDGATLQDLLQDRVTMQEKRNKNRPPKTERREIRSRPIILRISKFNYLMKWRAHPIIKDESISANRFRESTPDEVYIMQRIHYVLRCDKPNNKTTRVRANADIAQKSKENRNGPTP